MTATNPHPLANPLNHARYAAYEMQNTRKPGITHSKDASKLEVPQSTMSYEDVVNMQNSLTVPYSALDDIGSSALRTAGFIGKSSLFMLYDGSVLDLKTHKIVLDPNKKFKLSGYWNDPNETITQNSSQEWGKTDTIESLLAHKERSGDIYDPNLSPESIRYWQRAKEESKKLVQNMTDEQKELMKDLENEKFFPKTRLVDET